MENVRNHRASDSPYKTPLVFAMLFAAQVLLINSSSAENPWTKEDRPLIDEGNPVSADRNSWQEKKESQSIDESKYPPFDEDMTLGTGVFAGSAADRSFASEASSSSSDEFQYYDPQSLGQIPVYPGSDQGNTGNYYRNNQIPPIGNQYQPAYRPGYQPGYRPGYSGMSGFPFGSGNSGFPFGGSNGSGFPFSGGNSFMPFSNSGFW